MLCGLTRRSRQSQQCKKTCRGKPNVQQQVDVGMWQRKPSVASMACAERHCTDVNPVWLRYAASGNVVFCLKTNSLVLLCLVNMTFDHLTPKWMGFKDSSWNILYVTFGERSCIGFSDIMQLNRPTTASEYPTPVTAIDVRNYSWCLNLYGNWTPHKQINSQTVNLQKNCTCNWAYNDGIMGCQSTRHMTNSSKSQLVTVNSSHDQLVTGNLHTRTKWLDTYFLVTLTDYRPKE